MKIRLAQTLKGYESKNIIKDILPKNTVFIDIKKDEMDDNTRHFNIWRNV